MVDKNKLLLPPAPGTSSVPAPAFYLTAETPEGEPENPSIPVSHYLWILRRHLWKMIAFVLTCVAATFVISSRLTPIYASSSVIDIDRQAPSAVVGQDSTRSMAP